MVAQVHGCELRLRLPRGVLKIEIRNRSGRPLFLNDVTIAFDPSDLDDPLVAREYKEFVHSSTLAKLCGAKKVGLSNRWLEHNPESGLVYVLQHMPTGKAILWSTLPPHCGDCVTFRALHKQLHMEGEFGVLIRSEQGRLIPSGRKAAVTPIQCRTGDDPLSMLDDVGTQWAKSCKRPLKDVATGWNSWDYFAGAVNSSDMHKNQRKSVQLFGDRVRYFVVDEGWEPRWGDWVANWKFPEGLKAFCRKVKSNGGVPGIWTAPLLVNAYTRLFRDRPEWFCRDEQGQIVQDLLTYGPMARLDVTHPEAEAFIEELFRRLRREGFEYFKIDFAHMVLDCARFHDMTVGRGQILRKAYEAIRRGIGDDAYLLGCGAPFESVTGIVDAVRVTGDIHNFWCHVLANAANISGRWWMHRKLWNIDPDFFIVRSPDTSPDRQLNRAEAVKPFDMKERWKCGREMVLNEVQVYALVTYLSGGDIVLGDDLTKLDRRGVEIIRKVLETPSTRPAVPLDLFGRHDDIPALWVKDEADFCFVGVFNWSEDVKDCEIRLRDVAPDQCRRIRTFWSGETLQPRDGMISLTLPPRSCEGLMFLHGRGKG